MRTKIIVTIVVAAIICVALWKGVYYLNFTGTRTAVIPTSFVKVNPEEYGGMNYFFYAKSDEKPFYAIHANKQLEKMLDKSKDNNVQLEFLVNGRWYTWGIMTPKFNGKFGSITNSITIEREVILRNAS